MTIERTEAAAPTAAPAPLQFPWGDERPAVGQWLTLQPGLHWVRMPLPFALDHINLWVLDDALPASAPHGLPGYTVVDSGVHTAAIQEAWVQLWAGPMAGGALAKMVVTHMHPDHVGNAQWLIERFGCAEAPPLCWMSATDWLAARVASETTSGHGGERAAAFFASHGLTEAQGLDKIRARGDYYASMVPQVPGRHRRLLDDMAVSIGGDSWRCIAGYGHAPEHMALYCANRGVLISGDMLLPRISTNISVIESEPEADPLGLFLHSLSAYEALPADTVVLPSHGLPFVGIHARVAALRQHHADRLDDILQACATQGSLTAAALLPVLFKRALDLHQTSFAMGEAVAHLNHLWHQGQLQRHQDDGGVWRFTRG
ncbi:MBL fold metallo-hydrolase [Aquabacterium lacunae]|uniref:MBL fold metallo-hydrolase n=1 Tax=Aquabacterium lacunae TaxID=2528630 RepID=A0A4Q9H040_9BURK|nr:MBL fold metallo-hydrolase [Aquabacterium lacunae]TBO32482.1 MBL fold metallo-hydrolase [Aquabacterium lacunae]